MIINHRSFPIRVLQNNALLNRLPENHPKIQAILQDSRKRIAGYNGEKELDYYLSLMPSYKYHIFNDLRLELNNKHFQIDSFLYSTYFSLILEVKNMKGTVTYDSVNHQLLRTYENEIERFQDPTLQTQRQRIQLKTWLAKNNIKVNPIEELVIISNQETFLDFNNRDHESLQKIIYSDFVLEKIEELERKYHTKLLTSKHLDNMSDLFLLNNEPQRVDILKKFGISPADIIPGVKCMICKKFSMIRTDRSWVCTNCHTHSKDAHIHAILENLLINLSITNEECRKFLQLPKEKSPYVKRALNSINLPYAGTTFNRIYYLPKDLKRIDPKYFRYNNLY